MPVIYTNKDLPERAENDFYPTQSEFVDYYVKSLLNKGQVQFEYVLDPGAGTGIWGEKIRKYFPKSHISGIELDKRHLANIAYDEWYSDDYLLKEFTGRFDTIIGNPPFSVAEEFIHTSFDNIKPNGHIILLLRLAFVESGGRYKRMFSSEFEELRPVSISASVQRISFRDDKKASPNSYAMFVWKKGHHGKSTKFNWISWR